MSMMSRTKSTTNKIVDVIGDIHGDATAIARWAAHSRHDILFAAGDVGLLFGHENNLAIVRTFEKYFPNKIVLMVPGNHDDYDQIEALPPCTIFDAKAYKLSDQFYYIDRGEVVNIDGTTYLCISGAESIDREWRLNYMEDHPDYGPIWWQRELITPDDINKICDNMSRYNWQVDYVISHEVPTRVKREIFRVVYGPHYSSDLLWDLANQIYFSTWYCAHLHLSYKGTIGDMNFIVLDINEIQEVL